VELEKYIGILVCFNRVMLRFSKSYSAMPPKKNQRKKKQQKLKRIRRIDETKTGNWSKFK